MKISCNVFRKSFDHKPIGWEVGYVQNNLIAPVNIEVSDLAKVLVNGGNMRIVACKGRGDDDFVSGQLIGIDTDNTIKIKRKKIISKNPFKPEDVRRVLGEHGIKVNFQYKTWSDTEDLPKFRTIILLSRPVKDITEYRAILNYCISLFDEYHADRGAETVSRVFFGSGAGSVCYEDYEAVNDTDELLHRCVINAPESEKPKKTTVTPKQEKKTYAYGKGVSQRVIQAIEKHDTKYLKKLLGYPETVVDNRKELRDYIYHDCDMSELLQVNAGESFACCLPDHGVDVHPSASVFVNGSGVWLYCCHADCMKTGKGKTFLNLKQFVELIGKFKSEYQSTKFLCEIFNVKLQETAWSVEQLANIDSIMSALSCKEGIDSFDELCPTASKTTRNAIDLYMKILAIAKNSISPQKNATGNIIFSMSVRQIASRSKKTSAKAQAYLKVLLYHHLIEAVSDVDVPPRMLARAIKHGYVTEDGKVCRHASFYQIPSWVVSHITKVELQGQKWKAHGYRVKGISFEMFARSEPEEAKRLYPQSCKWKKYDGSIEDRKPSPGSDERHMLITEFILESIEVKGFCTEKEILEHFTKKDLTFKQITRSMDDILSSYDLKKVRCNKVLKERFKVPGNGYPNIIIRR